MYGNWLNWWRRIGTMGKPRYFIAVFGEPQPDKGMVESGVYAPDPKYAPFLT